MLFAVGEETVLDQSTGGVGVRQALLTEHVQEETRFIEQGAQMLFYEIETDLPLMGMRTRQKKKRRSGDLIHLIVGWPLTVR